MEQRYKLLWLTGPMKGREIKLPFGHLSMGPDGDLMVPLPQGVEPVLFEVSDEGVKLLSDVPVWTELVPTDDPVTLPLGQAIEIAGVAFLLGSVEQVLEWRVFKKTKVRSSKGLGIKVLCALFALIAIFAMVGVLMLPQPKKAPFDPQIWLAKELSMTPELKEIKTQWKGNNESVVIEGYCGNIIALNKLIHDMKSHFIVFDLEAICIDQLIINTKTVLVMNGYTDVDVQPGTVAGSVKINGPVQAGPQWSRTTQALSQVRGLLHWQVSNDIGSFVQKFINQLRDKKLLDGLMIERRDDVVLVAGNTSEAMEKNISDIADAISADTGQKIVLRFENIPISYNQNKYLNGQIVSFGGNQKNPFVDISNGARLMQASKLDNGFVVTYLDFKGVDLNKDGDVVHIPFML